MKPISVIITAYNVQNYIYNTVQSVLSQTLREIEIIVVDDGSKDNTAQLLDELAKTDGRLIVIHKENGGVSAARNSGLETALGEYILFVDGDDQLLPNACELLYAKAVTEKTEIVVSDFICKNEVTSEESPRSGGEFSLLGGKEYGELALQPFYSGSICNKLIKRSLYTENKIFFPVGISMGEDFVTLFELACCAEKVSKLNEPTFVYLNREGSLVTTISPRIFSVTMAMTLLGALVEKYYGSSDKMREKFELACYYHVMYARVICCRAYGGVHKKLYEWYQTRMQIPQSQYFSCFRASLSIKENFFIECYKHGYYLGALINMFLKKLVYLKSILLGNSQKITPAKFLTIPATYLSLLRKFV
jgi:glycosyltransferase involved in cell wall biosynthesis